MEDGKPIVIYSCFFQKKIQGNIYYLFLKNCVTFALKV